MVRFYKYQAIGNDFVILDSMDITPHQAATLCDRHFGIGADGVLIYHPSRSADASMKIYNSDGSIAKMCGNGIRCFLHYIFTYKGIRKEQISVETGGGVVDCRVIERKGKFDASVIALGKPEIMENVSGVEVKGEHGNKQLTFIAHGVDIKNPHLVLVEKELNPIEESRDVALKMGGRLLKDEVNVEVVRSIDVDEHEVEIVVRERGAGFTLGCGTGGGAVIYALNKMGLVEEKTEWNITFPGGTLKYFINDGTVYMKGSAQLVFSGEIDV